MNVPAAYTGLLTKSVQRIQKIIITTVMSIEGFSAITRYVGNYEFWENGFEDTAGCRIPYYGHICLSKMRIILIPICTEFVG